MVEKRFLSNCIYFIFEIESKTDFDMAKGPCFRKYMFFNYKTTNCIKQINLERTY